MSRDLGTRISELHAEFDAEFSRPPRAAPEESVEVLAIRVAGAPFALRLSEVASLRPFRAPTPLPDGPFREGAARAPTGLLGLAADSGHLCAVYDLAAVLGRTESSTLAWLVAPRADPGIALAFDGLDGLSSIPSSALVQRVSEAFVSAVAPDRAVLDLGAITSNLNQAAR